LDEDGRYVLGDDALACLRDLKRWLKLYDEKLNRLDVARCLAEAKLVTGDLLPILASWQEEKHQIPGGTSNKLKARVALSCLEILVPLTWPLETPAGEMTVNHHRHTPHLQQAHVLYKAGILGWDNCSILRQIVRIALPSIAMSRDERTPRDDGIIKLALYFLRNVAVIRQIPNLPSQGLEMEVSRSATINAFVEQDVFAVLLTMCSNMGDEFNLQDVILLEILFNLIKGVDVKKLWMTTKQREHSTISALQASLATEDAMDRQYRRHAPSRHNRFGTMIWVKREDHKASALSGQDNLKQDRALFNMDQSKHWSKPRSKQKGQQYTIHDFTRNENLTEAATQQLRNFVEEFLDSGFNPLFAHLRKAIEREAERLLDVNYRQFFYCVSWFLETERERRHHARAETNKPANVLQAGFEVESYALVAAVLNQETFILLNRYMQTSVDNKEWQDLSASMRCFTQILLTVQEMGASSLEDDQEIAENIMNRIFYEETTHDRIVSIIRGYKDQGFGYLDACTELASTFLRVLERYSKENVDLQVRSRRRARQKKKEEQQQHMESQTEAAGESGQQAEEFDVDSEKEELQDTAQVSRERKFDFNRFASKFVTQSSVDTFVALLSHYKELSVEQLKRAHRFFYRAAFKQDQAILLYRVDVVALFHRMVQGDEALDRGNAMAKEFAEFSKQLFKRMTRKLEERPALLVEMLFSKINSTLFYLEHGHDKQTSATVRPPAELEVRPGLEKSLRDQIGIVVTALLKDEKSSLIQWLKNVLLKAIDERSAWELEAEARLSSSVPEALQEGNAPPLVDETAAPGYTNARPTTDEIRTAMFKNARLKLLMKLCGLHVQGDEDMLGATWIIPGSVKSVQLREAHSAISDFEARPWLPENPEEEAADMLRRVPKKQSEEERYEYGEGSGSPRRDAFIDDDSEGEAEYDFPDNIRAKPNKNKALEELKKKRSKRKRDSNDEALAEDDAAAAARRKARKEANDERRRKHKSELYIHDSDDETDEEADKAFFAREAELRRKQEANIRKHMSVGISAESRPAETRRKDRKDQGAAFDEADLLGEDADLMNLDDTQPDVADEDTAASSQRLQDDLISSEDDANGSEDDDDEQTPLSSQSAAKDIDVSHGRVMKEMRQPRADIVRSSPVKATEVSKFHGTVDEEDEDLVAPRPNRRRGGFIMDSDDDE
jgi:replication fork protection complex subunit Tof1/Swi1